MKKLDTVTLISIVGKEDLIDPTLKALRHSTKQLEFAEIKILCSRHPADLSHNIVSVEIPKLDLEGYSRFCIDDLYKYVDTKHCLLIQWDGFVINPELWEHSFLAYDYIGAPWGAGSEQGRWRNRIGNGGFSLRSQKFLQAAAELEYDTDAKYHDYTDSPHSERQVPLHEPTPEDWFVCVHNYDHMVHRNIKFPDIYTASRFSVEWWGREKIDPQDISTYKSLGFHGAFNTGAMGVLEW